MKFTKEEINLCKEIASYYWKDIHESDNILVDERVEERIITYAPPWVLKEQVLPPNGKKSLINLRTEKEYEEIIPLWTIQDCLDFLEEKDFTECIVKLDELNVLWNLFLTMREREHRFKGNTILETFLRVILKIVKEKER